MILIEGVNDRPEDAAALVRVAREVKAKVNCIPYNSRSRALHGSA